MKKIVISLLTLILIMSLATFVSAATTATLTLAVSKDTVKAGDEFAIVVTATDSNNLNTVEYSGITITDENGNEISTIAVKSIEAVGDNWAKMNDGDKTNFVYSGEITQSQEVFKVTFTVKEDVTAGTYNINVNNLKVYSTNLEDDMTDIGTKTISVKAIVDNTTVGGDNENDTTVGGDSQDDEQQNEIVDNQQGNSSNSNNNTNSGNTNANNSSSGNKTTNTNKNVNKNTTKLPQTGAESASIFGIIVLGAISIASYVSYRKYKNI